MDALGDEDEMIDYPQPFILLPLPCILCRGVFGLVKVRPSM